MLHHALAARSALAASALTRLAGALLLCALLWLTVAWALDWALDWAPGRTPGWGTPS